MMRRPSAPEENPKRNGRGRGHPTSWKENLFAASHSCSCMRKYIDAGFTGIPLLISFSSIGKHQLDAIIKHYKQNGLVPRTKTSGKHNPKKLKFEEVEKVKTYLANYASAHALTLPGRIPGFKRSDILLLPSSHTKSFVYKAYKSAAESQGKEVFFFFFY